MSRGCMLWSMDLACCINSLHNSPFLLPNLPPKFHVISLFLLHSIRIPVLRSPMYWLILLVLVIILVEMCTMPHNIQPIRIQESYIFYSITSNLPIMCCVCVALIVLNTVFSMAWYKIIECNTLLWYPYDL